MNTHPLTSVIIPLYNMEQFINETLDSVIASKYTNIEVIVMDDGSTDNSYNVALEYASKHNNMKVYTQKNAGVCVTRNNAISIAQGEYILPLDADNTITDKFISNAIELFLEDPEITVVSPSANFFGNRTGKWELPKFSLDLIARKNIMDTCAIYRKSDWARIGGYCEEMIAREDWEFWISMLKDGGKVVRIPEITLHYRIRNNSKRVSDRKMKKQIISTLNKKHPEFFERMLGGPLHYQRTWSKIFNRLYRFFNVRKVVVNKKYSYLADFFKVLPIYIEKNRESIIYKGRNELFEIEYQGVRMVVKSFRRPNIVNQIAYGLFRDSKAERSYKYAHLLLSKEIKTPEPIGFYTERNGLFFDRSYYACLKSECPFTYADLVKREFENQEKILRAIAATTASLHENGYIHKDYSRGNILFKETTDGIQIEVIDLNRIRFHKVTWKEGCRNFKRLPGTPAIFEILADEYAKQRGGDKTECLDFFKKVCTEKIYL